MLVLKKEKYDYVTEEIKKIRAKYPTKRSVVEFWATMLRSELVPDAHDTSESNLQDVEAYGEITFSPSATAFHPATGQYLRNHGDIYVTVWIWNKKERYFWCRTAWGTISEKRISQMAQPIIELS